MWKKDEKVNSVKRLQAGISITQEELFQRKMNKYFDSELKMQFAQKFVDMILEEDLITIEERNDMYTGHRSYEALLVVAEPSIAKVIMSDHYYEVDGHEFSHKEIEQAIKDWKPELFL